MATRRFVATGFNIYWVEDPCLRDDFVGLAQVAQAAPFCRFNTGEYLSLHDKHKLIEHKAVDILNVHGHISDTLKAAWLAAEYGLTLSAEARTTYAQPDFVRFEDKLAEFVPPSSVKLD